MKAGRPIEGVNLDDARAIKAHLTIPVINTGGMQSAKLARDAITNGHIDAVSMARGLVANPDLPKVWKSGRDVPEKPCSFCNLCLTNAPKNPMGCYDLSRFENRDAMVEELMSIYETSEDLVIPS